MFFTQETKQNLFYKYDIFFPQKGKESKKDKDGIYFYLLVLVHAGNKAKRFREKISYFPLNSIVMFSPFKKLVCYCLHS